MLAGAGAPFTLCPPAPPPACIEEGAGFSGTAGCTPSTANQCAFHFTPAELAIPAGRGSFRYDAKSISSSGVVYIVCGGMFAAGGGKLRGWNDGIASGRGGIRMG